MRRGIKLSMLVGVYMRERVILNGEVMLFRQLLSIIFHIPFSMYIQIYSNMLVCVFEEQSYIDGGSDVVWTRIIINILVEVMKGEVMLFGQLLSNCSLFRTLCPH